MRCVITGAADGIGRSLAVIFAANGYAITGIDVDGRKADDTRLDLAGYGKKIDFLIHDLWHVDEVANCAVALMHGGPIDVLIHNVGISAAGRMTSVSLADQLKFIRVNLFASMLLTAALLRGNKLKLGGSIVFMNSLSDFVGYPGRLSLCGDQGRDRFLCQEYSTGTSFR